MAILNYTTKISIEKTIMEIQKCLVEHGATKIVCDYEGVVPIALTFCLPLNDTFIAFLLPANYDGVLSALQKQHRVPKKLKTKEQALRVSWRILKDWVEAQMALVESQLADITEVFLPYSITKSGTTLYNEIKNGNLPLLIEAHDVRE